MTKSLPDPQALLFDLDGTLVDTVETRIDAWLQTLATVGIAGDRRQMAALIGADGKRSAKEMARAAGKDLDDHAAELIDRQAGIRFDELNVAPQPPPGARQLLLALQASALPWAIATSSRRAQVAASVEALRLPTPPVVVDGTHVRHAKPAPDLLLLAAERLGLPPDGCWYVGDATWDMLAAGAAGMPSLGVTSGAADHAALVAAGADAVIGDLAELHVELQRRGYLPA